MLIIEEWCGNTYMGSRGFDTSPSGYAKAMAEIERILAANHRPGGDAGKVMAFFNY